MLKERLTRREFLRLSGVAAVGFIAAACERQVLVPVSEPEKPTQEPSPPPKKLEPTSPLKEREVVVIEKEEVVAEEELIVEQVSTPIPTEKPPLKEILPTPTPVLEALATLYLPGGEEIGGEKSPQDIFRDNEEVITNLRQEALSARKELSDLGVEAREIEERGHFLILLDGFIPGHIQVSFLLVMTEENGAGPAFLWQRSERKWQKLEEKMLGGKIAVHPGWEEKTPNHKVPFVHLVDENEEPVFEVKRDVWQIGSRITKLEEDEAGNLVEVGEPIETLIINGLGIADEKKESEALFILPCYLPYQPKGKAEFEKEKYLVYPRLPSLSLVIFEVDEVAGSQIQIGEWNLVSGKWQSAAVEYDELFQELEPTPRVEQEEPEKEEPEEYVAIGNVTIYAQPDANAKKYGRFVPGQRFIPTGRKQNGFIEVKGDKYVFWVNEDDPFVPVSEYKTSTPRPPEPTSRPTEPPPPPEIIPSNEICAVGELAGKCYQRTEMRTGVLPDGHVIPNGGMGCYCPDPDINVSGTWLVGGRVEKIEGGNLIHLRGKGDDVIKVKIAYESPYFYARMRRWIFNVPWREAMPQVYPVLGRDIILGDYLDVYLDAPGIKNYKSPVENYEAIIEDLKVYGMFRAYIVQIYQ